MQSREIKILFNVEKTLKDSFDAASVRLFYNFSELN